jgi:hypothetical protein
VVGLSRLADIENKGVVPSLHRLYSLCAIYRQDLGEVLEWYGVDLAQILQDGSYANPPKTHPVGAPSGRRGSVALPLKLEPGVDFGRTTYLSRVIQQWGRLPLSMLDNLDIEECRYGIIGTEDFMMFPLLRPGTLVQIDENQSQVQNAGWMHEFDRPIYFIELREGYACCWCSMAGEHLILQPHPGSPCEPVVLRVRDADVIGRVIGFAMQLAHKETKPKKKAKVRSAANLK